MQTFAGSYVQEPGDLLVVATEAQLILALCDGLQVTAQTFDELSEDELAVIQRVGNSLIGPAEKTLESYAKRRGYAIPLSPVDADVMEIIANWFWIGALQRGGTLSSTDANKQREDIRDGVMTDIATGKLTLTAAMNTVAVAPESNVYSVTDAATRSTGPVKVERMSRALLSRF